MKLLIFGDIHGNLVALEKMLNAEKGQYDIMVCHGDVVNYGPWSNECVELLNNINCPCTIGNHEEAFLAGDYTGKNLLVKRFFSQTYKSFNNLDIISNYTKQIIIEDFKITHTVNDSYYFPDSNLSTLKLEMNTIIGHSHYPFIRNDSVKNLFINTGSVGQNRKNLSIINYLILDTITKKAEIKNLEYEPKFLISEMKAQNYPIECIAYYNSKIK